MLLQQTEIHHKNMSCVDSALIVLVNQFLWYVASWLPTRYFFIAATTLCLVGVRGDASCPPSLWCVRGGMCWLLSGQRPLLCLGWKNVFALFSVLQAVRRGVRPGLINRETFSYTANQHHSLIHLTSVLCCHLFRSPFLSAIIHRRSRRQDVRHGNPIRQCRGYNSNGKIRTMLSCELFNPKKKRSVYDSPINQSNVQVVPTTSDHKITIYI